jgi:hypothetical protein
MRRLRSKLTFANVCSFLALLIAVGTGSAYAANTIGSTDIINGEVKSVDIGTGQVQSIDVKNGSLNDEDVGQGTVVNFAGNIGVVPAHTCVDRNVTGINAQGDHLLLTPSVADSFGQLVYSIEYRPDLEGAVIVVCNPSDLGVDDEVTHFNLLIFDAQ